MEMEDVRVGSVSIPYWLGSKLRAPPALLRLKTLLGFNPLLVGV